MEVDRGPVARAASAEGRSMITEEVTLEGHIIDSLILSKVLDEILAHGAEFRITEMSVGQTRDNRSFARVEVSADSREARALIAETEKGLG